MHFRCFKWTYDWDETLPVSLFHPTQFRSFRHRWMTKLAPSSFSYHASLLSLRRWADVTGDNERSVKKSPLWSLHVWSKQAVWRLWLPEPQVLWNFSQRLGREIFARVWLVLLWRGVVLRCCMSTIKILEDPTHVRDHPNKAQLLCLI